MKKLFFSILLCALLLFSLFSVSVCADEGILIMSRESITLFIDQSYTLTCSVYNNDNSQIDYSSSDADVAEVSEDGTITAVAAGIATITAQNGDGLTAFCDVEVVEGTSPEEVIISSQYITLSSGSSTQISAQVVTEGSDYSITYFSSDTSVATVSDSGEIKALNTGVAVITAESASSAVAQRCIVKVTTEATSSLGTKNISGIIYDIEGTIQTDLILYFKNGSSSYSSYTNSNGVFYLDNIPSGTYSVTVQQSSDSSTVATGTLSVVDSDIQATCIISNNELVIMYKSTSISSNGITAISIESTALTMVIGDTATIYYSTTPSDDEYKNTIVISSSDEDVVTVDSSGTLTAVDEGSATITFATPDGKISKQCEVTVESATASTQYSAAILICEVIPLIAIAVIFAVKYRKFIKNKEKEEMENEDLL